MFFGLMIVEIQKILLVTAIFLGVVIVGMMHLEMQFVKILIAMILIESMENRGVFMRVILEVKKMKVEQEFMEEIQ